MRRYLKHLYRALPFKRQLFTVARNLGPPPKSIYQHLHFQGPFEVHAGDRVFTMFHYGYQVENELFWEGVHGWEGQSLAVWAELCKRSRTIIDIGANTGVYALLAKTLNPQARVIAFEPVARVFEKLEHNRRLNDYSIECVMKAVSDKDGIATIFDLPSEHVYSVTVNKNLNPVGDPVIPVQVETIRLDTFFGTEIETIDVDLIKIDVETHEPEVLRGMGVILQRCRPWMLIEVLSEEVGKRIEALLVPLGYSFVAIDEAGTLRHIDSLLKAHTRNILACPTRQAATLMDCLATKGFRMPISEEP